MNDYSHSPEYLVFEENDPSTVQSSNYMSDDPIEFLLGTDFTEFRHDVDDISYNHITQSISSPLSSVDEYYRYLREPTEENTATPDLTTADEQLAINNAPLPVTRPLSKPSIPLSNHVVITDYQPRKLQLVHPLEQNYRPRYKSDYFPQNGPVRRPRYIADSASNHYITLRLSDNCLYQYIRVALITISIPGRGHYYSPYKFQRDHDDINIPDENPVYLKVEPDQENTMKLQLVLIKSKLDQLNYIQPLKLFSDETISVQRNILEENLPPKELINKYQLDKSQIAFTLCTKLSDGSYKPHPETTIISSIINEVLTSKKSNDTNAAAATSSVESNPHVCCPQCAHQFDPDTTTTAESNDSSKRQLNRKSTHSLSNATAESGSNRKKKTKKP